MQPKFILKSFYRNHDLFTTDISHLIFKPLKFIIDISTNSVCKTMMDSWNYKCNNKILLLLPVLKESTKTNLYLIIPRKIGVELNRRKPVSVNFILFKSKL